MTIAVVAAALVAGAVVSSTSATIDPIATETALRVRLGQRVLRWRITVADGDAPGSVAVELREGPAAPIRRNLRLRGRTSEERSRELASALALVIEQSAGAVEPAAPAVETPASPTRAPLSGWLALSGRVGVGRPPDPDGGLGLRAGTTWGGELLQPLATIGWTHAQRGNLRIDGVRVGLGLAIGSPLAGGALWLGGSVVPQLAWTVARDRSSTSGVSSTTELAGLLQWRGPSWLVGLRIGAELTGPPLRAIGEHGDVRLGVLRFVAGLDVGLRLPGRRRAPDR